MDVEVVNNNHTTEIAPNTNVSNGNNNAGSSKDVVPAGGYVIPYTGDLVEPPRVSTSSGQRIKLQAEITIPNTSDCKFLTICDPLSSLAELKAQLEIEYNELYPNELPIVIVRLQDSRRNDMPLRFKIGDLLKEKDKVYIVIKPTINPEDESGDVNTPKPRGRKRKNDHKDIKGLDTPNKKPTLSSLSPNQLSPSQSPTASQLHLQQQLQPLSQITPYSPSAKALAANNVQERVVCNPYCALIETRDNVPCQHCGELRPYVVPDSEKTDRNQCSKWCVTGSTRKLKAAGLEFCSICLARHRAGKYDLRKAHQCLSCHRPWLHLDEYMYCRTCRKSAMGTDKEPQMAPPPMTLSNSLSILSGNGTPMHLSSQPPQLHLPQPSSLLSHRILSPPHHISLHDLHKRSDLEKKAEQKAQSIPLQQLHLFQQQSQQLLGVNSPQHHSSPPPPSSSGSSLPMGVGVDKGEGKDNNNSNIIHHHHHHRHDNGEEENPHAHAHTHPHETHAEHHDAHGHAGHAGHAEHHDAHAHADPHSAEQLAEMVLSQIPSTGQEGEPPLTNSYYDPTLTQEKVGS